MASSKQPARKKSLQVVHNQRRGHKLCDGTNQVSNPNCGHTPAVMTSTNTPLAWRPCLHFWPSARACCAVLSGQPAPHGGQRCAVQLQQTQFCCLKVLASVMSVQLVPELGDPGSWSMFCVCLTCPSRTTHQSTQRHKTPDPVSAASHTQLTQAPADCGRVVCLCSQRTKGNYTTTVACHIVTVSLN